MGFFQFTHATSTMKWSDEMFAIHGYVRGDVVPTLDIGFAHIASHDQGNARALWADMAGRDAPSAWYYTLIDAHGRDRQVLAVAEPLKDNGTTSGIKGFLVDITTSVHDDAQRNATTAVERSAKNRAVIEQAKGALMITHGIDADTAFECLSRHSQRTNRKVNLLAGDLLTSSPEVRNTLLRSLCAPPPTPAPEPRAEG